MNNYAAYLIKKLKDFGATHIVIKNTLIDMQGHIIWNRNDVPYCKKCSIIGVNSSKTLFTNTSYFISLSRRMHGDAIHFSTNWNNYASKRYCIDDPALTNSQMLESIFMQIMAISEKKNIWLQGQKLFEKGQAFEHLVQAELTIS